MKKGILIALAALLLAGVAAEIWTLRHGAGSPAAQIKIAKIMYNCAMHPQYISDKPGNCPICGMKLVRMDKEHADSGSRDAGAGAERKILYWRDPMHPWYTSDKPGKAPDCGMDLVPIYEGDGSAKGVRIDPATVQNMGVKTEAVGLRDMQTEIRTSGMVKVDQSKLTSVNARVMGYAEKVAVSTTGEKVRKGQTLLELYSPDLVSTQEEYLQALRYARGNGGGADLGASDLVESSRRRLLNWGISENEIASLEKAGHARNVLPIVSPAQGIVMEKMVVQGQNVMPGMELYRIADLSKVWIVASVYQRDLAVARMGADADVELNYLPGKTFKGKVTSISPGLNALTMTSELRVEVANTPALDFRPEMFATVHIRSAVRHRVVAVPEQAIIRSGRRDIAVVALGNGYFEPREVRLGASSGDYVEITEGLHEGETLVVSSQFLIDSESNLKAAIQQMQGGSAEAGSAEGANMGPAPGAAAPGPAPAAAADSGAHPGTDGK
jgi:multidrug efflux pump subunit AcrA (membrane-fusion protein)